MATTPPTIAALPAAPSTSSPSTFDADADAFVAAMDGLVSEVNDVADNAAISTIKASDADTARLAAQTAAAAAAVAAGAAIPAGYGQLYKTEGAANVKTTTFTSATGRCYDCDTTGGPFTGSLPPSPGVGDLATFRDYAGTWETKNFTVGRNGQLIAGSASDFVCDINNLALEFIFVGGTKWWAVQ